MTYTLHIAGVVWTQIFLEFTPIAHTFKLCESLIPNVYSGVTCMIFLKLPSHSLLFISQILYCSNRLKWSDWLMNVSATWRLDVTVFDRTRKGGHQYLPIFW